MSPELRKKVTSALKEAGKGELAKEVELEARQKVQQEKETLTSGEAANILGVSSPTTVKNWLESGMFPGAYRTKGGHWRFPKKEVEEARSRMEALREKNEAGELEPHEKENPQDPPLL